MQKYFFHNGKLIDESIDNKNINNKISSQTQDINEKKVVDINKLLNRVKIEQKNETKKKIFFYSSTVLALGFVTTFIAILK